MSSPIQLSGVLKFCKSLGTHAKLRLKTKHKQKPIAQKSADSFYVLYVMTCGLIDDLDECLTIMQESDWGKLPLQVHFLSMNAYHLEEEDL